MSFINNMTLVLILVINSLQEAGGIPTGTPPIQDKPFVDFFALSYSVVVEEIGFRLLPIGIFLLVSLLFVAKKKEIVLSLKQKIKLFFLSILVPDKAKKMADTKTVKKNGIIKGISMGEWGILLFTSLIFGLAHFNPGFSWEIGKISSAAVSGLIIGLSYLIYGAPAAIILHWFFNSYMDTFFLLSEVYPIAEPFANVVVILSIILGVIGWGYVIYLRYHKLVSTIQEKQKTAKLRLI
ncbi:CPBP family intramembrane metalloprotease [Candidatus Bathyarchaeota archaeon]|nr:CPBP family intramembrane metalloprotease [Candidatus Bathyarchaeota archaeon]